MSHPNKKLFAAVLCLCALMGCKHFSVSAPAAPQVDPGAYTSDDYTTNLATYTAAIPQGAHPNADIAKRARNDIAYGIMGDIEVVYGAYYGHLFSYQSAVSIGSDALTAGLSTAAAIATHAATKTIFSALGTGIGAVGLSAQKNLFAQQTFPIIGIAMQTRRDKIRAAIIQNLALDDATYPLNQAKRDLTAYLIAGTLPAGLQELQEEAGTATAAAGANAAGTKPAAPGSLQAQAGVAQVSLVWNPATGATAYNLYRAAAPGVNLQTATKTAGISSTSVTDSAGLTAGSPYYYVVTAVNLTGESTPSNEVPATPVAPPGTPLGTAPAAPTLPTFVAGNGQVTLLWAQVVGATSYNLYWSTTPGVTPANGTKIAVPSGLTYQQMGLVNGTAYYYVVTAVDAAGESAPSPQVTATPSAPSNSHLLLMTPH